MSEDEGKVNERQRGRIIIEEDNEKEEFVQVEETSEKEEKDGPKRKNITRWELDGDSGEEREGMEKCKAAGEGGGGVRRETT